MLDTAQAGSLFESTQRTPSRSATPGQMTVEQRPIFLPPSPFPPCVTPSAAELPPPALVMPPQPG